MVTLSAPSERDRALHMALRCRALSVHLNALAGNMGERAYPSSIKRHLGYLEEALLATEALLDATPEPIVALNSSKWRVTARTSGDPLETVFTIQAPTLGRALARFSEEHDHWMVTSASMIG